MNLSVDLVRKRILMAFEILPIIGMFYIIGYFVPRMDFSNSGDKFMIVYITAGMAFLFVVIPLFCWWKFYKTKIAFYRVLSFFTVVVFWGLVYYIGTHATK